jgi:SAM-dependent methyltransferase
MTDPTVRQAIADLYAGDGWPAEGDELLGRSLGPRSPDLLLEAPGWLGLRAGQLVLDAGCRDGRWAVELARRYGCRVVGVDLVLTGAPKSGAFDATEVGGQVRLLRGDIEALPIASGSCDLVWCRDTLSCLGDCATALRECARVLRPGGGMVLYAVFAAETLAPGDRALVVDALENSAASMDQATVEAAVATAGLEVVRRERIGTEWSEHRLEDDPTYLTRDLLEVARLIRGRERMEAILGPLWYRRALAFDLWRIQIALGHLVPHLYALAKPA